MRKILRRAAALAAVATVFAFAAGTAAAATVGSPWSTGGYVSWSSDANGGISSAYVGYWTGGWGGEPWTTSVLYVPIEVGSGGTLDFDWLVQSDDSPYWDPVNIYLRDASGATIATYASYQGRTYGYIHAQTDLAAWAGTTVTLVVSVHQDGYGDQTQAVLQNLTVGGGGDTTPPVLANVPSDQTVEATGPDGATVTWQDPTATDDSDPAPSVSCSPASGSTFAIGDTAVTCTASDASGNSSQASFTVSVVDTTPPTLSLPADITVDATSPAGATVSYATSATDVVDGTDAVDCTPASGSVFPIGTTTVGCSATDAHDNTATGSFQVTVRSPAEMLAILAGNVDGVGPGRSLAAKVAVAQSDLAAGDVRTTISVLRAFEHEVSAQSGKKSLGSSAAAALTAEADGIIAALGG